jgi:uncharacterized membrane protein YkvA (DUF1232 family)
MDPGSYLAQLVLLVGIVLIVGFAVVLAFPWGKIRQGIFVLIGCGCVVCSIIYLIAPNDIAPDSLIDDLFALTSGIAALVAAIDAGSPDDPKWSL